MRGDQNTTAIETPAYGERECANHSGRMTLVSCGSCGKPLCPDCMVYSPVGIKCRDCAKTPRSARITLKTGLLLRAIAAGLAVGTAIGFAYYYILGAVGFFFFVFFVAAGIGYLVGETICRASGGYHGLQTAIVAVISTIWAFVIPPLLAAFISFGVRWDVVVFSFSGRGIINWVVMAVAAYLAWQRTR